MLTITAKQLKSLIQDAQEFDFDEMMKISDHAINNQLNKGLIDEDEAKASHDRNVSVYKKQAAEAKEILKVIKDYKN